MTTLYIAEISALGIDAGGQAIAAANMPPVTEQTVAIGDSSLASKPFGGSTRFVQISTDATCSLAFGVNPTATTSNQRLPADKMRLFSVTPGHKVAVISNT
jgi:hypothetical protein